VSEEIPTGSSNLSLTTTIGAGIFSREWAVVLELPLKQLATTERTHQIALRAVRQDFQKEIGRLETKLRLVQLQLNQRVFFGANASVHMDVKKMCMIEPVMMFELKVVMR
jgi:hypothetical protein